MISALISAQDRVDRLSVMGLDEEGLGNTHCSIKAGADNHDLARYGHRRRCGSGEQREALTLHGRREVEDDPIATIGSTVSP